MNERVKNHDCPEVVASAMLQVQKAIKSLAHDATNDFNGYGYVSIDGYYEAIRPLLNEAELMIVPNEVETMIGGDGKTQKVVFEFIILHGSGVAWNVPIRRTVYINYSGAQSSGAALSYAEKFILRTLFKIPTGEHDASAEQTEEVEQTATHTHDADSTPSPRKGQEPKADFDFSGAPYRIFNNYGQVVKTFTDLGSWCQAVGSEYKSNKKLGKAESFCKEIDRVTPEMAKNKDMTAPAKQKAFDLFAQIQGDI